MNATRNNITAMRDEINIISSLTDFYSQDNIDTINKIISCCRHELRLVKTDSEFYEVRNLLGIALTLSSKQRMSSRSKRAQDQDGCD